MNKTEEEISLDINGRTFSGTYTVASKIVTVELYDGTYYGKASTQVGGSRATTVARLLLRELVEGALSRGEL